MINCIPILILQKWVSRGTESQLEGSIYSFKDTSEDEIVLKMGIAYITFDNI